MLLEVKVSPRFGSVANKGLHMPIGDTVSSEPPFVASDWHQLLLQNPVQDVKAWNSLQKSLFSTSRSSLLLGSCLTRPLNNYLNGCVLIRGALLAV